VYKLFAVFTTLLF